VTIAIILAAAYAVLLVASAARRKAALARFVKPEHVVFHERLAALERAKEAGNPVAIDDDLRDAADSIEQYKQLFQLLAERSDDTWAELEDGVFGFPPECLSSENVDKARAFWAANRDAILETRRVTARGGPIHAVDVADPGFGLDLSWVRVCARWLGYHATFEAFEGNPAEVVEDLTAGLRLADGLATDPLFISQLSRYVLADMMCAFYQVVKVSSGFPPGSQDRLLSQISATAAREGLVHACEGETGLILGMFSDVRNARSRKALGNLLPGLPLGKQITSLYASTIARPWLNMDECTLAQTIERVRIAARQPYCEARTDLNELGEAMPSTRLVCRMLFPTMKALFSAQAKHEARMDLWRIGIAVEKYHSEYGHYPLTLDVVSSDLGGTLPLDPFTGQPYRYVPSADKYLLYSLGPNQIDDGGVNGIQDGDIVWRHEPLPCE